MRNSNFKRGTDLNSGLRDKLSAKRYCKETQSSFFLRSKIAYLTLDTNCSENLFGFLYIWFCTAVREEMFMSKNLQSTYSQLYLLSFLALCNSGKHLSSNSFVHKFPCWSFHKQEVPFYSFGIAS